MRQVLINTKQKQTKNNAANSIEKFNIPTGSVTFVNLSLWEVNFVLFNSMLKYVINK